MLLAAVALCSGRTSSWTSVAPEYVVASPARVYDIARDTPSGDRIVLVIKGTTIEGDEVTKTVAMDLGEKGADGRKRLADAGLTLAPVRVTACRSSV